MGHPLDKISPIGDLKYPIGDLKYPIGHIIPNWVFSSVSPLLSRQNILKEIVNLLVGFIP